MQDLTIPNETENNKMSVENNEEDYNRNGNLKSISQQTIKGTYHPWIWKFSYNEQTPKIYVQAKDGGQDLGFLCLSGLIIIKLSSIRNIFPKMKQPCTICEVTSFHHTFKIIPRLFY